MTNSDVATKSEAAVEKALRDMRAKPDQSFAPKDRQSLTDLLVEIDHANKAQADANREQAERIASAKHVLALILGGLK